MSDAYLKNPYKTLNKYGLTTKPYCLMTPDEYYDMLQARHAAVDQLCEELKIKRPVLPFTHGIVVMSKIREEGFVKVPLEMREADKFLTNLGTVIDIGPTAFTSPEFRLSGPCLQIGDSTCYRKYEGLQITYDEIAYQILDDDQVRAHPPEPELFEINPLSRM